MDAPSGTRGILNPSEGLARFGLQRLEPTEDLAPFLDRHWIVRWDLRGAPPHEQETLPHPCCHLAFEPARSAVHGVGTKRFVARLEGRGRVIGTKFQPAGFAAFWPEPIGRITDRVIPVDQAFGQGGAALAAEVLACDEDARAVALVEQFLRERSPAPSEPMRLANELVGLAQSDRSITRAEELARAAALSLRSLQRLFERHVGVGAKWVIQRARVQEAAERAAGGARVDWAALAQELGYHDQAHFIREFKAQVGQPPAAYGVRCASGAGVG